MTDTWKQSAGNSQLDWLAGLIDGEGTISFAAKKGKYGTSYMPMVSIANNHKPTIDRAADIFKEHGLGVYICTNRDKRGKYPAQYSVFVSGFKRVSRFLEIMRDKLFTKAKQFNLLVEYIALRSGGHCGRKLTEQELNIVYECKKVNNSRYWDGSSETLRVGQAIQLAKIKSTPTCNAEGFLGSVTPCSEVTPPPLPKGLLVRLSV